MLSGTQCVFNIIKALFYGIVKESAYSENNNYYSRLKRCLLDNNSKIDRIESDSVYIDSLISILIDEVKSLNYPIKVFQVDMVRKNLVKQYNAYSTVIKDAISKNKLI